MNAQEIKRQVPIERVFEYFGHPVKGNKVHCPFPQNHNHDDRQASVSLKNGRATCFSQGCFQGDDIFAVVGKMEGLSNFKDQKQFLERAFLLDDSGKQGKPKILRSYRWSDKEGRECFHRRMSSGPKFVWNSKADGTGRPTLKPCTPDLYQRDDVLKANIVIVCAGERDVETINEWLKILDLFPDHVATANHTGESSVKAESFVILHGKKRVYVLGDNDPTGLTFRGKVLEFLQEKVGELFPLTIPKEWNDPTEWGQNGGTAQDFQVILDTAKLYIHPSPDNDELRLASSALTGPALVAGTHSTDQGLTKEIADKILRGHHFAQDQGGLLYQYDNGVYRPKGKEVVAQLVKKILEDEGRTKSWSSHRTNEIFEYIRVGALVLWPQPPLDIVNVRNGLLHLDPMSALKPHTPEHLCSIQLPVTFDPEANCPGWDQFIQDVFPDDAPGVGVGNLRLLDGAGGLLSESYFVARWRGQWQKHLPSGTPGLSWEGQCQFCHAPATRRR